MTNTNLEFGPGPVFRYRTLNVLVGVLGVLQDRGEQHVLRDDTTHV